MTKDRLIGFEFSTSGRRDGTIEAAYIQLSCQKVVHTREIKEDALLADYSADGKLVGIEILAPVRIADLQKLVTEPARKKPFRKFVKTSAPPELITA